MVLALALLAGLVALAAPTPQSGAASGGTGPGATQPADPTAGLSARQLAGQRVIYAYDGTQPPAALEARIARGEAAGIILFTRNIGSRAGLRRTLRRLQAIPRPAGLRQALLIMIDQEGGLVKRLSGAPSRSAAEVGRTGSTTVARTEGRNTGANLRDVGVNVNLAPVVDVGRPGSYQRRTGRSYGGSAGLVAAMASAFVRGMRERNVAGALKHFPGLGPVALDEDAQVQRVPFSASTLRTVDEFPFGEAAAAGAQLVMTSTARYPALSTEPALLSRVITTGELRGRLRFRGLSMTDDLQVPALRRYGGPETLAVNAARAGNDLLLYAVSYDGGARAMEAVVRAARSGRIPAAEMRAAVRRVLALRASL